MAKNKDLFTIANDFNFQGRCMVSAVDAAIAVMAESQNTVSHDQRVDYARRVLSNSAPAISIALAVLSNPTIAGGADVSLIDNGAGIVDGDIQFAVNSVFNALAGVAK